MKVTVERAQLLKSLGHVHRVVERRNTIPILGNVLVRAENARLSLKATDLDLEVTETLAAETATGGSTTVPAHMFYDIVRKLPDGAQIVLEADGDRSVMAIRAGRSRFTLQTLPESDFPDLAAGDMTHSFSLGAAEVKRLIDRTQFAISTEETRYYLNGIYLHTAGSAKAATLRGVATDGHRLAQIDRHDLAAEIVGRGLGQVVRRLALERLEEHSVARDLAQRLAIGRARHRDPDRTRRAVARQPDHADVVAEVLAAELRADAEVAGQLQHLLLEVAVAKGVAQRGA